MSFAKRQRSKLNKVGGAFLALPHGMLNSVNFKALSPKAVKLLLDISVQYYGTNNGDLQATWTHMNARGWKSRETLDTALRELQHYGFIEKTRQGGLNKCSLFAVTWRVIDDCGDKYDAGVKPTNSASNEWKMSKARWANQRKQNASTEFPTYRPAQRDNSAVIEC